MTGRKYVAFGLLVIPTLLMSFLLIACGTGSNSTGNGSGGGGGSTPQPTASNVWTWVSGSNTAPAGAQGQPGVYGTEGVAATTNVPGGRDGSVSWTDNVGNLWLFGGGGYDATGADTPLNDLWEFDTKAKTWTWEGGSSVGGLSAIAIYGTEGTAAPGNVPGERHDAVSCADKNGNLWLFGGLGKDSSGTWGTLNDLWKFNPATREWTWVSGASTVTYYPSSGPAGEFGQLGAYGTQGIPAASNVPGGRFAALAWTDSSGNLWLFGGYGFDSTGMYGFLNDLWEFNPTTTQWTWVSGASTMPLDPSTGEIRQQGVYGTQGIPAASNVPGGRDAAVGWTDSSGNLWLFGGSFASTKAIHPLNDLWEFDPAAKTWTWISGAETDYAVGVYGTQGVAAATNVPGARYSAVSWTDSSSNLWLFGGRSYDSVLAESTTLNDVWKFDATTKMWTWMSGADTPFALGVYGTQGVAAATNMPGARWHAVGWTDSNGDFWLFGGAGTMELNDLWRYQP